MMTPKQAGVAPEDGDYSDEEVLERYDRYIVFLAWQVVVRHTQFVPPDILDLIDDVTQNSRIKLWLALQTTLIRNMKSFIAKIVYHEFINEMRRNKATLPLPLGPDGELKDDKLAMMSMMGMQNAEMGNPELIVIGEMEVVELLGMAAKGIEVMDLNSRQGWSMVCSLKDAVDDVEQMVELFQQHGLEIAEIAWPEEKEEMVSLKANLSAARKKMRSLADN